MKNKLNRDNIRAGEERAYSLFREKVADAESGWIEKTNAFKYRGLGRAMIRRIFAVARHVEGSKMSKSLGKRGVDVVSLDSVRTAINRVADGLLAQDPKRQPSPAGSSLKRFIQRTEKKDAVN